MTPREVIARALYRHCGPGSYETHPENWRAWVGEADAVIDALEKMEPTSKMIYAAHEWNPEDESAVFLWKDLIGAMKHE